MRKLTLLEYMTATSDESVDMMQVHRELDRDYNGREVNQALFKISALRHNKVTIWYDLTFSNNTREGAYLENRSTVDYCNRILQQIADKYKHLPSNMVPCTRESCRRDDQMNVNDQGQSHFDGRRELRGSIQLG
jgi:hypothetical protein